MRELALFALYGIDEMLFLVQVLKEGFNYRTNVMVPVLYGIGEMLFLGSSVEGRVQPSTSECNRKDSQHQPTRLVCGME